MDKQLAVKIIHGLEESIQKWEDIVASTRRDQGTCNCSLCQKFNWTPSKPMNFNPCVQCPVYAVTGRTACQKTPYEEFNDYLKYWNRYSFFDYGNKIGMVFDERSKELAQAELDFLKSLWQTPYVLEAKQILSGETQ